MAWMNRRHAGRRRSAASPLAAYGPVDGAARRTRSEAAPPARIGRIDRGETRARRAHAGGMDRAYRVAITTPIMTAASKAIQMIRRTIWS